MRRVGRSQVPARDLYLAELSDPAVWPETLAEPRTAFVTFTAIDASDVPSQVLTEFDGRLIAQGCVYLCAWGPGCERVHDAADAADVAANPPDGKLMTTWHDDEPLDEALYFALLDTVPEEEAHAVVAIVAPPWAGQVERRFSSPELLRREILDADTTGRADL